MSKVGETLASIIPSEIEVSQPFPPDDINQIPEEELAGLTDFTAPPPPVYLGTLEGRPFWSRKLMIIEGSAGTMVAIQPLKVVEIGVILEPTGLVGYQARPPSEYDEFPQVDLSSYVAEDVQDIAQVEPPSLSTVRKEGASVGLPVDIAQVEEACGAEPGFRLTPKSPSTGWGGFFLKRE